MKRVWLASLLLIIFIGTWILHEIAPDVSVLIVVLASIAGYGLVLTAAMVDKKRQEIQAKVLAWARRLRGKPKHDDPPIELPWVTVVVPAHNEALVIATTVKNLLKLRYPTFDVLVVDDRSEDATPQILAHLKETLDGAGERFHYFVRAQDAYPGKSAVLNDAMATARGDVLAVFDADAQVPHDYLEKTVPFLANEKVGAVQGRKIIINHHDNLLTRCQNFEYAMDSHFQCGRDAARGAVELRGNGQLVKKAAVEAVGGWNNQTVTDDLDLSTKLHLAGWDIRFVQTTAVYEEGIQDLPSLIRQRTRWAEGSLTRYLEYGWDILTSKKASFRAKIDMISYFVQFFLPIWLMADYVVVGASYLLGEMTRTHLITALWAVPVMIFCFMTSMMVALARFHKLYLIKGLFYSLVSGTYLVVLWMPVVCGVTLRFLFRPEKEIPQWEKTIHHAHTLPNGVIEDFDDDAALSTPTITEAHSPLPANTPSS